MIGSFLPMQNCYFHPVVVRLSIGFLRAEPIVDISTW